MPASLCKLIIYLVGAGQLLLGAARLYMGLGAGVHLLFLVLYSKGAQSTSDYKTKLSPLSYHKAPLPTDFLTFLLSLPVLLCFPTFAQPISPLGSFPSSTSRGPFLLWNAGA